MHGRGAIDHRQCGLSQNDRGRRERDSNPRYLSVHTISNRAPSATRTPLPVVTIIAHPGAGELCSPEPAWRAREPLGGSRTCEERVGVEPTLDLRPNLISNQALSATQPPLQLKKEPWEGSLNLPRWARTSKARPPPTRSTPFEAICFF